MSVRKVFFNCLKVRVFILINSNFTQKNYGSKENRKKRQKFHWYSAFKFSINCDGIKYRSVSNIRFHKPKYVSYKTLFFHNYVIIY